MTRCIGFAYDIGGGVAYACPTCKEQTPADLGEWITPQPDEFWPLDPKRMNGTERCESCGKSLNKGI